MATETDIANLALTWLGQRLINSLNDNQNEAKIMKANYPFARDKVLEEHAWTFALRRETLAPLLATPAFGGGNQFLIPSDVARVFRVYRPSSNLTTRDLQNAEWVREGNVIIAPYDQVWAHFIFKQTNTTFFSASFGQAVAAKLAMDTCITFTENEKLMDKMETKYGVFLQEATAADGSQGRTEVIRSTKLTGVRTR
jgi:hypothetical protein